MNFDNFKFIRHNQQSKLRKISCICYFKSSYQSALNSIKLRISIPYKYSPRLNSISSLCHRAKFFLPVQISGNIHAQSSKKQHRHLVSTQFIELARDTRVVRDLLTEEDTLISRNEDKRSAKFRFDEI